MDIRTTHLHAFLKLNQKKIKELYFHKTGYLTKFILCFWFDAFAFWKNLRQKKIFWDLLTISSSRIYYYIYLEAEKFGNLSLCTIFHLNCTSFIVHYGQIHFNSYIRVYEKSNLKSWIIGNLYVKILAFLEKDLS